MSRRPQLDTFKDRLRWLRRERGFAKAADLARAIEKEPRTVYRYERGDKLPKDATLDKLCAVLGTNALWLKHGHGSPFAEGELPGVEAYLRHSKVSAEVARALREWPYDILGMANPSEDEVGRVALMVEMCLAVRDKRAHDDGEQGA